MKSSLINWLWNSAGHFLLLGEILLVVVVGVVLIRIFQRLQLAARSEPSPRKRIPPPSQFLLRFGEAPPTEPQICTVCEQPGTPKLRCPGQDRIEYGLVIVTVALLTLYLVVRVALGLLDGHVPLVRPALSLGTKFLILITAIYTLGRVGLSRLACPACGGAMVPLQSKRGQRLAAGDDRLKTKDRRL